MNRWIFEITGNLALVRVKKSLPALLVGVVILASILPRPSQAQALLCATPGKDGIAGTIGGIVNTYYPGTATTTTNATSITLGTARGASTQITSGDLLIVMQMQDTLIDSDNNSGYGNNVNGSPASGYLTTNNNSGRYEFVRASNTVPLSGGTLNLVGAGTGSGLLNVYTNADFTTTAGQKRFQVIRVPQYASATLSSTLTAAAWNGSTGGVLSIDVAAILALGSATVNVSGLGFRGGGTRELEGGAGADTDYRTLSTVNNNGSKGEGIAGTPRFIFNSATNTTVDNTDEGYPNGSYARGAPGNAGGGGTDGNPGDNDQNTGGGGGGNGGAGGTGGNAWNSQDPGGGFGGAVFAQGASDRLVMGGGGGAATRNDNTGNNLACSGAAGGAIVLIRAGILSGTGTITSDGANAYNDGLNDGGGGGGAGGTVMVWSLAGGLGGLTANARGGEGGDAWRTQAPNGTPGERHGPGGGGGGGVIRTSAAVAATSVTGGTSGITTTALSTYGATNGSNGTASTTVVTGGIPGVKSGAECASPTAVEFGELDANSYDQGVLLKWSTGYEVDNLGFNVYREVNGRRTRVNQSLLAGSALTVGARTSLESGQSYAWLDPEVKPGEFAQYWIESIDLNGDISSYGPITPQYAGGKLPKFARALAVGQIGSARTADQRQVWDSGLERPVAMAMQARGWTTTAMGNLQSQWDIASKQAVKLLVRKSGWYRVAQPDLMTAGLNPFVDPRFLQLFVDGNEVPIRVNGGANGRLEAGDSIEFYATALDSPYSDSHVYYLTSGASVGRRVETVAPGSGAVSTTPSFPMTLELRERTIYFAALKNGDAENWFGPVVSSSPISKTFKVRNLSTGGPVSGDTTSLDVVLQGVAGDLTQPVPHSVEVSFNGMLLGTVDFVSVDRVESKFAVPAELLAEGDNTVTLRAVAGGSDFSFLDFVRLTYNHKYAADSNSLRFTARGGETVKVGGFGKSGVRVVDLTDPNSPRELQAGVSQQGGSYTVSVTVPDSGTRSLYAFTDDQFARPAGIVSNQPSTWNRAGSADILMIGHGKFLKSLQPLITLRRQQKFEVSVVDIEDLYDEFSFGAHSPQAIKEFLRRASAWKKAPRFVLLVGDASIDSRDYLGLGETDLLPTKVVESAFMETASDDWFADFDDTGLAAMAIGRLPVRTVQEAQAVIAKVVKGEPAAKTDALLVADRNDGFNFEETQRAVKALLPRGTPVQEVLRSKLDDASARSQILAAFNRGTRIVNYNGHGSSNQWRGKVLANEDVASMTNSASPSLVVSMTCLNGLFNDPISDGLGELLVKWPGGGAFAVWASSGIREPLGQSAVNQELFKQLFQPGATLGESVRRAKAVVSDPDIRRTWILFGDPASRLSK